MKNRNGFVSNSSTSSFVIIVAEEDFEDILSSFTEEEYYRKIVRELFTDDTVARNPAKTFSYMSGNYNSLEYEELSEELTNEIEEKELNVDEEKFEAVYRFKNSVQDHEFGFVEEIDY